MSNIETQFKTVFFANSKEPKSAFARAQQLVSSVGELLKLATEDHSPKAAEVTAAIIRDALATFAEVNRGQSAETNLEQLKKELSLKIDDVAEMTASSLQSVPDKNADPIAVQCMALIAEQLGMECKEVLPHHNIIANYGADSLDVLQLVMAFEDAFVIEIPDSDAEKIVTVRDVIDYIRARLKKETGRMYVNIRKHPDGYQQPTGKRKITRLDVDGDAVKIGIGDGSQGWKLSLKAPQPEFLDFILNTESGERVSLAEAVAYWQRHHP